MDIHLVVFNTKNNYGKVGYYDESVQILINSFKENGVDYVHHYTEETLPCDDTLKQYCETYKDHGYGFWVFKPLIILDVMDKINEGDVVIYHDAGRPEYRYGLKNNIRPLVNIVKENYQGIGLAEGGWSHNQLTRDECFKLMECDTPYIREKNQLAATWGIYEKNPKVLLFLNDWKKWCLTHDAIRTEEPGEVNHSDFHCHRHDQSILTNLFHLYSLKTLPSIHTLPWEKDINGYITDCPKLKVLKTFNNKQGLTLIVDVFYKYNQLHVVTTGAVTDVRLVNNNELIEATQKCMDPHDNAHCFKFDIPFQSFIQLNLIALEDDIDNTNINFVIKENYFDDYPNEHVISIVCHSEINSFDSIKTFIKYHFNLGYDRIVLHENGGKRLFDLCKELEHYVNDNKVVIMCYKNLKFYQQFRKTNLGPSTIGEIAHMNHSRNLYKSSKYLSCFNIDELIVPPYSIENINDYLDSLQIQFNTHTSGGIEIRPNDFQRPEDGKLYYESKNIVSNVNNMPKVIYFPKNIDNVSCHCVTKGEIPIKVDKDILTFNHYPFLDNNRGLGETTGYLDNLNYNLFN
jgi:hypothetical protein